MPRNPDINKISAEKSRNKVDLLFLNTLFGKMNECNSIKPIYFNVQGLFDKTE